MGFILVNFISQEISKEYDFNLLSFEVALRVTMLVYKVNVHDTKADNL